MIDTRKGMDWVINTLRKDQSPDGSWNYPFETGISTDAYMIILLRTLKINDEELIMGLCKRILSRQAKNGAWQLFYDEGDGNLTATVEAYYALLYSGYYKQDNKYLLRAQKYILTNGGLKAVSMFTKVMLSITGQYTWPDFSPLPIEVILLPHSFPINFYSFSVFGRANFTPILLLADKKFSIKTKKSPDLTNLQLQRDKDDEWIRLNEYRSVLYFIEAGIKELIGLPAQLHQLAIGRAKKYLLDHIEPDGTLFSYFSSTFLMIFALLSHGYKKTDPVITNAITGIMSMKSEINGYPHIQYTTANVWNTSLIGYTLQAAGITSDDPMVVMANEYLLAHQHHKFGDWVIHNSKSLPGGWGFSDVNTMNPDVDDTTASLRSIARITSSQLPAWERGIGWLLSMQNSDGGWGESCHSDSKKTYVPLQASTLTHTSWALDALISASEKPTPRIRKGISYLLASLEKENWTTAYPKGQGMAGGFYIHYHSYRYIFPLLALSHYQKKFES